MSRREDQPAEIDERGDEVHPGFGMIQVHRYSVGGGGAVLFDSDIKHGHTVAITLHTATRKRDLNRDWIHPGKQLFEVEMSEAQWASFVSSMGSSGVPCTIRATESEYQVSGLEYDPRLAHSMDEVTNAAAKTFGPIQAAMAAYDALDSKATAKEKREALNAIRRATMNAEANIEFAANSLTEHAENVVQRSRADIEAMALQTAQAMGLPTGTRLLELGNMKEDHG